METEEIIPNLVTYESVLKDHKKVNFDMTACDSNAFMLLGLFQRAARKAGWSGEAINAVRTKAMDGDYDNLVGTLSQFCK